MAVASDAPGWCSLLSRDANSSQGFRPPRRRPSYFSLRAQREVTKRKGTRLRRRTSSGALRCSPDSGRRELAHPCARTCAPFPRARLRCSAPETGGRARSSHAVALDLCPVDRGGGPKDQCAASRAGSARVSRRYMDVPSRNPAGPTGTRRSRARSPGRLLFGYFLLATQEKVARAPPRRTKPREEFTSGE